MSEEKSANQENTTNGGNAAVQDAPNTKPAPPKTRQLPPFKVLLHNDDKNEMEYVVKTICRLTPLKEKDAVQRMFEAHKTGVAMLLVTHQERAELYVDQFASSGLVATAEPDA